MDECIQSLGEAKLSSTVDPNLGYREIEMDQKDGVRSSQWVIKVHREAFWTEKRFGYVSNGYKCNIGYCEMAVRSRTHWWHFCISKAPKKHLQHDEEVLKLLSNAEMTMQSNKCSFCSETI